MNDWFKIKIPPSIGQNISEFGKRKGQFIFFKSKWRGFNFISRKHFWFFRMYIVHTNLIQISIDIIWWSTINGLMILNSENPEI